MSTILDIIDSPADLRKLSERQLEQLAQDIRDEISRVVAQTGGHLASSLGAVELTIALHRCFDFGTDAVVWDVGHQAYAHKLLTGRRGIFHSLRQRGGMSGFPNKHESPYDLFTAGHAGTSISQAIGLVCADELVGRERKVVAVIGDGSLTSGMALEALNYAGSLGKDILVVLNDNHMSISATVGGLSQHLDHLRATRFYNEAKREVRRVVSRLPYVGDAVEHVLAHLKDGIKATVSAETLFDQLGFRAFGPIDGHSIADLMEILEAVRDLSGPVLLHVVTEKGRGHGEAESDPTRYHSAKPTACPVEEPAGEHEPSRPSYTSVFAQALCRIGGENDHVVAITAAMEDGTGLVEFARRFPDRFFDVGICEQHAVAFAGALGAGGLKPVLALYSTFLQRGYDQVFHDLCLQETPAVICMDRAGIVGPDGATHQGVFDIAYLRHLPNLLLAAPKDGPELEAMLEAAVADDRIWAIRIPKALVPAASCDPSRPIEVGRGELLRDGTDAALVAYGAMVERAARAAELLAERGIQVAVANARFAKPLDTELVCDLAGRVGVLVTVEDHARAGGFGSAVLEALAGQGVIPCRLISMGIPDQFIEHGGRDELLAGLGLSAEGIAERVSAALSGDSAGEGTA